MPDTLITNESPAHPSTLTSTGASPQSLVDLRKALTEAERLVDEADSDDSPLIEAYHEAQDRFVEHPSTSLADVLLKIERLAEVEDLAMHLRDSPHLLWVRLIDGLIRDLRAITGANGQVQ